MVRYSFTEQSKFLISCTVFRKKNLQEKERVDILKSVFNWNEPVTKSSAFKERGCINSCSLRQVVVSGHLVLKPTLVIIFTMAMEHSVLS